MRKLLFSKMNILEEMNDLERALTNENISFEKCVSLKKKTWLKRGGWTRFWMQPNCIKELETIANFVYTKKIQFEIIGNSSNCYFSDNYNPIITISTLKVTDFDTDKNTIKCGCGYNLMKLSRYCINSGISGYEGFIGLPGTVGGAALNNSGSYGSIISDVVKSVELLKPDGNIISLSNKELEYDHRSSTLKKSNNGIILSVEFDVSKKGDIDKMKESAEKYKMHRKNHQENKFVNLGSIHSEIVWKKKWYNIRYLGYRICKKIVAKLLPKHQEEVSNYFLFLIYCKLSIFKNVSKKSLNCFVWKNRYYSDTDFFNYINFFKTIASKTVLEIEIKE